MTNSADDKSIETSEDDAEPFPDLRFTNPLLVRLERAERALQLAGFTLSASGE
ncbi:hypothetical protein [Herbaspirillum sp. NPDC101396]|uniref:hypothetical protein n=1 Tax=Herbaspirillum sp. NPDC101396 TaxID=3364005 RepID=UPI00383A3E53